MRELPQEGRDLRYYLRLVWLRKWWILAVLVVIPTAVYLVSKALPKTYESSTTLRVSQGSVSSALGIDATSFSDSAEVTATLIKTTAVAERAARQLGEPPNTGGSLLGQIDVQTVSLTGSESTEFLTITARADQAQRAADVANAFARAIANARTSEALTEINQTITRLQGEAEQLSALERAAPGGVDEQLQQLRALKASQQLGATGVIEPAAPAGSPVSPQPNRNAAVGFVLAVLIAAGLVPLFERVDRRLRDADDLEQLLRVPVLVHIPETAFPGSNPTSEVREAFQTLRASLTAFNIDRSLESVIVSSAMHGEGKTTVATNLAIALAQDERDVILVDGDLRRPQVMSRFGSRIEWGLDAVLLGERQLDDALLELEVEGAGRLRLLPGGATAPNPAVLLGSRRMRSLLGELSARTDLVVLDTPPILAVSDAIPLLDTVSGTVLVARVDYSSRDALLRAAQVVEAAGGSLLGAVATGTRAAGLYGYEDYAYDHPHRGGLPWRRSKGRKSEVAARRNGGAFGPEAYRDQLPAAAQPSDLDQQPKQGWRDRRRQRKAQKERRKTEDAAPESADHPSDETGAAAEAPTGRVGGKSSL